MFRLSLTTISTNISAGAKTTAGLLDKTSTVAPSPAYPADSPISYTRLCFSRPFVKSFSYSLTSSSLRAANTTNFVRSGCRPNDVLRPVLYAPNGKGKERQREAGAGVGARSLALVYNLRCTLLAILMLGRRSSAGSGTAAIQCMISILAAAATMIAQRVGGRVRSRDDTGTCSGHLFPRDAQSSDDRHHGQRACGASAVANMPNPRTHATEHFPRKSRAR